MIKGNCLCGKVHYEVLKLAGPLIHCHCNYCRKTHTAAFSSNLTAKKLILRLQVERTISRSMNLLPESNVIFVPIVVVLYGMKKKETNQLMTIKMGSIEEFPEFEQQEFTSFHIHCESDKPWLTYENLEKHQQLPK